MKNIFLMGLTILGWDKCQVASVRRSCQFSSTTLVERLKMPISWFFDWLYVATYLTAIFEMYLTKINAIAFASLYYSEQMLVLSRLPFIPCNPVKIGSNFNPINYIEFN